MRIDLGSHEYRRNPHPAYASLRQHAPVHWDDASKSWYVTRFDDVNALLADDRLRSRHLKPATAARDQTQADGMDRVEEFFGGWPIYDHSGQHIAVRKALLTNLAAGPVRALEPRIAEWTRRQRATLDPGQADLVVDFARPVAMRCFTELLGISAAEAQELISLNDRLTDYTFSDPDHDVAASARSGTELLDDFVHQVLLRRGSGLAIAPLVPLAASGELSRSVVVGAVAELVSGTVEPLTTAIARAVHELARDPRSRAALKSGDLTRSAVTEEVLRYDPSFHFAMRVATAPLTVRGQAIAAGQQVILVLASADRDESRWPDGATFDPSRARKRHLAFGRGPHACLGAALVRAQTEVALEAVGSSDAWLDAFARQPLKRLPLVGVTEFRRRGLPRGW
ncbi:MAG TPA: cytochrome P450 [Candidatus Limnocylindrales bacterium]|nr:cytochrome P450 [Candidatus Limnocylindrales bacterium]